jgi:hypothetical protein
MSGIVGDNTARASGVIKAAGGGKILQVVQTVKTDTSQLSSSFADVSGLTVAITPSSTSSKIYIACSVNATGGVKIRFILQRDIGGAGYANSALIGDTAGSRERVTMHASFIDDYDGINANIGYLDPTNTTSEVTYKLRGRTNNATYFCGINCGYGDADASEYARGASTITAWEIGE